MNWRFERTGSFTSAAYRKAMAKAKPRLLSADDINKAFFGPDLIRFPEVTWYFPAGWQSGRIQGFLEIRHGRHLTALRVAHFTRDWRGCCAWEETIQL